MPETFDADQSEVYPQPHPQKLNMTIINKCISLFILSGICYGSESITLSIEGENPGEITNVEVMENGQFSYNSIHKVSYKSETIKTNTEPEVGMIIAGSIKKSQNDGFYNLAIEFNNTSLESWNVINNEALPCVNTETTKTEITINKNIKYILGGLTKADANGSIKNKTYSITYK